MVVWSAEKAVDFAPSPMERQFALASYRSWAGVERAREGELVSMKGGKPGKISLPPFSCLCANSGAECLSGTAFQKMNQKTLSLSFPSFVSKFVMKTLYISKVMCFISWWFESLCARPSCFTSVLNWDIIATKLLVSVLSVLQFSVPLWASPWDLRDEIFLSAGLFPLSELQGVAPGEPQGAGDEQEPRFTWKHLIQDSSDQNCLGKVSGWSRCAGALRSWSKQARRLWVELCAIYWVSHNATFALPHRLSQGWPPITVASGATACSMRGSAVVYRH